MNTNRNTFGGSRLYTRGNAHLGRNYSLAKLAIVGLVGLMVLVLSSTQAKANNVLLIIADDFGVDSHGLYGIGSSTAPTPTIDELALDGVQFLRAWSNPICSPTRATLLTGRYSFRTGVGFPVGGEPSHQIRLNEFTLPDALSQLGYRSAAIGKWHLSGDSNGEGLNPNFMGFDHYSGSLAGFIPDYYNWTKTVNGVNSTVTNYATTENVDDALAWISGQGSSPWFLWLAFNAGHSPFHKPPNELHSYDSLSGTQQDINNDPVPYYQAMIEAMDTEIGRLLSSIDLASTDIIFIGDNGTPSQVAVPPADSSRVKATLYQGGVWVPWIVSGPSVIGLPRTNSALVNTTDIFATIIELAGGVVDNVVPASVTHDSISILPLLEDPALGVLRNHVVAERFRVTTVARDGKTIRNDEFKLIRFDSGSEEFYDLFADETELLDLLGETLTATEQANYDSLTAELDNLLYGDLVVGEGFILSKNADFSTDDRIFSRTDTLYMLMWSDVVDFNNMKKAEFELMDTKRRKVRQNLSNNLDNSFMTTFVLANLPSNLTSWEWKGKLEDNTRKKYQPNTNITVTLAATPPVADFSGTPTSGSTPLVVSFTDESTGSRSSWLWNFGDGNTSTAQSPSHTYSAAGSYDVTLTATNAEGSDTLGRTGYITVTMPPLPVPPVAAFSSAPTSGNAPLPVSFTDQSTGSPTTWSWDFGDGNSSTAQNPTHTYGTPGTYSVVLTVSNPQGSDSLTLSNYITVNTGGFTGQGFILSKNADFSTDDRIFSRTDTLYMLMWSDVVDFNNMKKAEFELMDTKRRKVRQNLSNNLDNSFTMTVVLADLPSNLTSWEWKGKLEDNTRKKYQPNTNITVN